MANLVASMSGVVLGGVAMVMGSNLARAKYLQHLSAQLIHYISLCSPSPHSPTNTHTHFICMSDSDLDPNNLIH